MKQDDSSKVIITIVIFAVLALAFTFNRNNSEKLQQEYDALNEKYTELEDKYINLEEKYTEIYEKYTGIDENYTYLEGSFSDAINKCEDPLAVLFCYFEKEDDISFEEAYDAFTIVNQQISQFY